MDLHILIVISCVSLASFFSLLLINKFFRRKTFEEVIAEKKALAEKIYGPKTTKKPQQQKKLPIKKDSKKDKLRQRQKDSPKENVEVDSNNDSDGQSEAQSVENSPNHKKVHVEFSEPEVINDSDNGQRRPSTDNNNKTNKPIKRKGGKSGILINKTEAVVIKEVPKVENLNHFEVKPPKDALELKKHEIEQKKSKDSKKINKNPKKEVEQTDIVNNAVKDVKQVDEKVVKSESPKLQNNKAKQQKKKEKDLNIVETLDGNDIIGVNFLMKLFSRAELNRSEIQILIDYLLNKQQDMPSNHSDWSDDVVQKIRKQLEEKEKRLQEEQEASLGLQAKLRDLRVEINWERAQLNTTVKGYVEEIQNKKQEIAVLNQDIVNLSEKFNVERQQIQSQLRHEQQAGSQELLNQIQQLTEHNNLLQNELSQKNSYISELQLIANASHQAVEDNKQTVNDIIQQHANQIRLLEQTLNEKNLAQQQYEIDVKKLVEKEKESSTIEILNLQNALETTKSELNVARNELNDNKTQTENLIAQNSDLAKTLDNYNSKCLELNKQQIELQNTVDQFKVQIADKDLKISEFEKSLNQLVSKEDELLKEIQEQKEKNNDLRTKNWKLNEALKLAEMATKFGNNKNLDLVHTQPKESANDEQKTRELLQRIYPNAVKSNASSALTLSFDQWVEQVLNTHIKQILATQQAVNQNHNEEVINNNSNSNHTSHNHNNINNSENKNSNSNNSIDIVDIDKDEETQKLKQQNAQLRAHIDELTRIVTKTENMLTNLETQAREQDSHWREVVQAKEEQISLLQKTNGSQDI